MITEDWDRTTGKHWIAYEALIFGYLLKKSIVGVLAQSTG